MSHNNDLNMTVLRRQLAARKMVNENIHNLARSMFKAGVKIQYKANGGRDYFGSVVDVVGSPGNTQVRVKNLQTLKNRDIHLVDVTGLVQEN